MPIPGIPDSDTIQDILGIEPEYRDPSEIFSWDKPKWGLINENYEDLVPFQTIVKLSIVDESKVVTTIIENGSFASYNKVEQPSRIQLTAILSGDSSEQQASLAILRTYKKVTDIVGVLTPFEYYDNLNITGITVERSIQNGATQTFVDLILDEIREVNVQTEKMTKTSQTKNATAVKKTDIGKSVGTAVNREAMHKALSTDFSQLVDF